MPQKRQRKERSSHCRQSAKRIERSRSRSFPVAPKALDSGGKATHTEIGRLRNENQVLKGTCQALLSACDRFFETMSHLRTVSVVSRARSDEATVETSLNAWLSGLS